MLRAPTIGVLGVVAGLLIIFANPIIEATFTTTSAAPLTTPAPVTVPAPVPLVLRPLLVVLFYPLLLLRQFQDVTFWVALAMSIPLRQWFWSRVVSA
jgi:hypothetical protein